MSDLGEWAFIPSFGRQLRSGDKCATIRRTRTAKPGDIFHWRGMTFIVDSYERAELKRFALRSYRQLGARGPLEVIDQLQRCYGKAAAPGIHERVGLITFHRVHARSA